VDKIKKLNIITGIVFFGFIIAIIYHYILGLVFHLGYPFNTFLWNPTAKFSDFTCIYQIFTKGDFNPYVQSNYLAAWFFPFGMLILYFFRLFPLFLSFILYYLIFIAYYLFYNYKNIKQNLTSKQNFNIFISFGVISLLSYPFLIEIDRGNIEMYVFLFTSLFVSFFIKEKYKISALMLAAAISIKLYPIVFLPLFIVKKRFKELFYCIGFVVLLTGASLFLMKESFLTNIIYCIKQMHMAINCAAINNNGLGYGVSLFSVVKFIIFWINDCFKLTFAQLNNSFINLPYFIYVFDPSLLNIVNKALKIFSFFSLIAGFCVTGYIIFVKQELWKKVFLLLVCMLFLTPVSADYKLIYLLIPMFLFINSESKLKTDWIYAVLFGLMLIPKNYIQFFALDYNHFNISVVLNPLILFVMSVIIVSEDFCLNKKNKKIPDLQSENI